MSYFYETDSDGDEKKPRKLNKKNCGKPPKRIIPLANKDKKHHEVWNPSRARDLSNFPSPARILILGPPNAGKSTLINLLADRKVSITSPIAGTTRDLI